VRASLVENRGIVVVLVDGQRREEPPARIRQRDRDRTGIEVEQAKLWVYMSMNWSE
jgi:hypothetical protein